MKDAFNREITNDARVAFNPPYYKGLIKGRVSGFTAQKVRVTYMWQKVEHVTTVYPLDLVVDYKSCEC